MTDSPPVFQHPEYPFQGHQVEVRGQQMHYLDEGPSDTGPAADSALPPVLMVHGNPTWSFYYRKLVLALRDRQRCLVPDHIGMGWSSRPDKRHYGYTLADRVADLSAFIEQVRPEGQLDLIVHDWGGMIGFAWAVEHPERIRRIVVLNTAAFPLPPTKRLPFTLKLVRDTALGAFLVHRLNAFARGATRLAVRKPMSLATRAGYLAPYQTPERRLATLEFVRDIPLEHGDEGFDLVHRSADRLERLADHPMLIQWGRHDFVFDDHFLAGWEARFPAADVDVYEDAGHYVLEDAADRIVPRVRAFLAGP
jgi:haloalkane dehalogenase